MLTLRTSVADVYRAYVAACRENGIKPTLKFLRYGIGQTIHEEPYLTDTRDIVFQSKITFTMEPLYMIAGEFDLHVEDMYVITKSGFGPITGNICPSDELIQVG
jgi:Xaa-Pro aminopeptidase